MKTKIKAGSIYRTQRQEASIIVLVISEPYRINQTKSHIRSRGKVVEIVPMTIEPRGENQYSLVAESILSFLLPALKVTTLHKTLWTSESKREIVTDKKKEIEATIWTNLMYGISCNTLRKYLGSLPSTVVNCCRQMHQSKPSIIPEGFRLGNKPTSIFEQAVSIEAELADELDILSDVDMSFLSF